MVFLQHVADSGCSIAGWIEETAGFNGNQSGNQL